MMAGQQILTISSFNMRGFNSGLSILNQLCASHSIIAFQEHWLREDELHKLALVHRDFSFHASSGMRNAVTKKITVGRPFGGTGFLWHQSLDSQVQYIATDHDGRCIAIKLKFNNVTLIIFNVYFPSYYDSYLYRDEISSLTGFIENVLLCNTYDKIIILGDTNFDTNLNNAGFKIFNSLLIFNFQNYKIFNSLLMQIYVLVMTWFKDLSLTLMQMTLSGPHRALIISLCLVH